MALCEHSKSAVVSEYKELLVHGADSKTNFIFLIFSINWPNLKLAEDIKILIFCAVQAPAENRWPVPDYLQ